MTRYLAAIAFLLLAAQLSAQIRLADTEPGATSISCRLDQEVRRQPVILGGEVFFAASNWSGAGIVASDGTPSGTRWVLDPSPATEDWRSALSVDAAIAGGVLFSHSLDSRSRELWFSDGTEAGTHLATTPGYSYGIYLLTVGDRAIYRASSRLVVVDGSEHGQQVLALVADDGWPAALGNQIVFSRDPGGLAISDGTLAGTRTITQAVAPDGPMMSAGALVYFADDTDRLWKTDGTAAGTRPVHPTVKLDDDEVDSYLGHASGLWFQGHQLPATQGIWHTAGTEATTRYVAGTAGLHEVRMLCELPNGRMLFVATPGPTLSDGSLYVAGEVGGVLQAWKIVSGIYVRRPMLLGVDGQDALVLTPAIDQAGDYVLLRTDGTVGAAVEVERWSGAVAEDPLIAKLGSRFMFWAETEPGRIEPWLSDGTTAGTLRLDKNLSVPAYSRYPRSSVVHGRRGVLDQMVGVSLWSTDGTPAGTQPVQPLNPAWDWHLVSPEDWSWLVGIDHGGAQSVAFLCEYDGSGRPPRTVAILPADQYSSAWRSGREVGNRLFFAYRGALAGTRIWVSDGTPAGTFELWESGRLEYHSSYLIGELAGDLLFVATDALTGSCSMYRSDGSVAGTVLLFPLALKYSNSSMTAGWLDWGEAELPQDELIFWGDEDQYGRELWRTDGTQAGTHAIDLTPGASDSSPKAAGRIGGRWLFFADNHQIGASSLSLFATDGSLAGTVELGPSWEDYYFFSSTDIARVGDEVVFAGLDAVSGAELWITDGTTAGTRLLLDIASGAERSSAPLFFRSLGQRHALFFAFEMTRGYEPWITDGTTAGTRRLDEMAPGADSLLGDWQMTGLVPMWGGADGAGFLFTGVDGEYGAEPWFLPMRDLGIGWAEGFGDAFCLAGRVPRLAANLDPVLGEQGFAIEMIDGPSGGVGYLVAGNNEQEITLPNGRVFHIGSPIALQLWSFDAAGEASLALPIPNAPNLLGVELVFQGIQLGGGLGVEYSESLKIGLGH